MRTLKEIQELKNNIPQTEIRQKIGSCGLWEYALFCTITGLEIKAYKLGCSE